MSKKIILDLSKYYNDFISYLEKQSLKKDPINLYKPIDYILLQKGKRIRPILTLIACDIFSGKYKDALPAAMAIEVFHNFTLVHDDIMDDAPLRRGKKTIHKKWNINTGILSGDTMLILAYKYFEIYKPNIFKNLIKLFTKTALEVCNGQQLDIDFETKNNVTIKQYIKMITLKTSVLVATALKTGAIIANIDNKQADIIYNFGLNIGIAFQLQDDYLDTFGDTKTFGKQLGGDIIENKKTFLYLMAIKVSDKQSKEKLIKYYSKKLENNSEKIREVSKIFEDNKIKSYTKKLIKEYTNKAFEKIHLLNISNDYKCKLINLGNNLMSRSV